MVSAGSRLNRSLAGFHLGESAPRNRAAGRSRDTRSTFGNAAGEIAPRAESESGPRVVQGVR